MTANGYRRASSLPRGREEIQMSKTSLRVRCLPLVCGILWLSLAQPAGGKTTKVIYPNACSEVWSAVTYTLNNAENYNLITSDDSYMTATYQPKHTVHVTITGALVQRKITSR